MIVDCQNLSQITISSNTVNYGTIQIDNGFGTDTVYLNDLASPFSLFCSGDADISLSSGLNMVVTSMTGGIFTENLLMGLAGIICGALLCYVMVKYAV